MARLFAPAIASLLLFSGAVLSQEFPRQGGGAPDPAPAGSPIGQPTRSEARLETLRNALIDQALTAPVRVSSSAWVDESGRLRHVSRFLSEVRARSAADLAFASDGPDQVKGGQEASATPSAERPGAQEASPGRPSADPRPGLVAATQASAVGSSSAPGAGSCQAERSGIQRVASVHTELIPGDGARGHAVLHEAARVHQDALRKLAETGALMLTAPTPVALNAYDRLLSSTGASEAAYRLEIRLSSDRADVAAHGHGAHPGKGPVRQGINALVELTREFSAPPLSLLPARRIDLEVSLRELAGQRVVLRQVAQVHVPGASPTHTSQVLPDSAIEALRGAAAVWWAEVSQALSCEPILVQAEPSPAGRVRIPVGAQSGVRVGDKWMIADRSRIPARVLEEGSIERALLAEVVSVTPHRSVLKFTSDAAQLASRFSVERGVVWFASPM